MSKNKLWGDFDSDDDREYLEQGHSATPVSDKPKTLSEPDRCVVNLHVQQKETKSIAASGANGWYRSGTQPKVDRQATTSRKDDSSWRAAPSNSSSSQSARTSPSNNKESGWRAPNQPSPAESTRHGNNGNNQSSPTPTPQPHHQFDVTNAGMNGIGAHSRATMASLSVNGQSVQQVRPSAGSIFIQPPNDTPTPSPRASPHVSSASQAPALLPGPWIPPFQPQPNPAWANFNGHPYHSSPRGRGSSLGSPRLIIPPHLTVSNSPRHATPLLSPSATSLDEHPQGSPSPRVLIVNSGAASPRTQNINYELEALYDMVPRPLAITLRQQTPSLLRNVVTLLLAQPYGLTWQELCVNYYARYRETLVCPLTSSGATMSPSSILSECCHRHEGLLAQDTPGKFRVKPDLLKLDTRPAVKKALLRLQEEGRRKICMRCRALMDDLNREELLCSPCAMTETKGITSPLPSSPVKNSIHPASSQSPSLPAPSQAIKAISAQLMPPDFRDLTVGGHLPNQILDVLPSMGLPFLQIPKAFQQKHGVSIKVQLKGKLAEFLETMSSYDLVVIDNKQGPLEGWRVRPLQPHKNGYVPRVQQAPKSHPSTQHSITTGEEIRI